MIFIQLIYSCYKRTDLAELCC